MRSKVKKINLPYLSTLSPSRIYIRVLYKKFFFSCIWAITSFKACPKKIQEKKLQLRNTAIDGNLISIVL
jgi:hypothetical protein